MTTYYVTQTVNGCQSPAAAVAVTVSAPADFSLSKTDPTGCAAADGTITVTNVTGGAGTYEYSLDGTNYQASAAFNGRGAGNYTVYVKDANGLRCHQVHPTGGPQRLYGYRYPQPMKRV
jgi:hypothetical protein